MTTEQTAAIHRLAEALGWDKLPTEQVGLILWAVFRYYAWRAAPPE